MGHRRRTLPSGIAELGEVIGERAALELALWRWARSAERAMSQGRPLPRGVSLHVPATAEAGHPFGDLLGEELARALSAELPGATITCQVPEWLLDHFLLWRGLDLMAKGASPAEVSRLYGKDPSAWSRVWNSPPRHNPLSEVGENIAAECSSLLLRRRHDLRTVSAA
jgi:hypothetical protein